MQQPEIILIERRAWSGNSDGKPYSLDRFELRGGDIAEEWAASLRVPCAPWCQLSIWNDGDSIGGYGGEVWPMAWPELFYTVGPKGRTTTMLTPLALGLFAAARLTSAIRALRDATAAAGGNDELVEVCDIALGDKPPPFGPGLETVELCRAECERELACGCRKPCSPASGLHTQAEVDAFAEAAVDAAIAEGM